MIDVDVDAAVRPIGLELGPGPRARGAVATRTSPLTMSRRMQRMPL